ncbi:oxidoreductase [Vibrio nereis]|uniref:oxidoreductase n=1 Tax=Vibrio nereis TaxID=693 RepID=UPI002495A857|nr:oxidoreductase [Vibrio nereis]
MLKSLYLRLAATALLCFSAFFSHASTDTILTINHHGEETKFSLEQLLTHADKEIVTDTPWTNDKTTFIGVSAKEILKMTDTDQASLKVTALNDYWSTIPYSDIEQYNPIFAVKKNGDVMSIRDKGPVWVIYPLSQFDEMNNEVLHSRMVWQVRSVEIVQ